MRDILFILVIYGRRKEESTAYRSLRDQLNEKELEDCLYIHDNTKHNIYLSGAYNAGWQEAKRRGKTWIVLLDDDTALNGAYIMRICQTARQTKADALVPRLVDKNGRSLSPFRRYGRLVAFNSGVMIRCSVIDELGGFSENYKLDYLDYWLFRELHHRGKEIVCMNVTLCHTLSIMNYQQGVSAARYLSILDAEKRFAKEEGGKAWRIYKWHLLGRAIKWTVTGHLYYKETWRAWMR